MKKRINIDLPPPGSKELETLQFIADWKGYKLKPYIEKLINDHFINEINNTPEFKDYYNGTKSTDC